MRLVLIVSQVIYVLALIPWAGAFMMTPMAFDSGISTTAVSLVTILGAYPIAVIVCSIIAWVLYRKRIRPASTYVNLIPCLWFVAVIAVAVFVR